MEISLPGFWIFVVEDDANRTLILSNTPPPVVFDDHPNSVFDKFVFFFLCFVHTLDTWAFIPNFLSYLISWHLQKRFVNVVFPNALAFAHFSSIHTIYCKAFGRSSFQRLKEPSICLLRKMFAILEVLLDLRNVRGREHAFDSGNLLYVHGFVGSSFDFS